MSRITRTRSGGFSTGPYTSLNLGLRVNDDPATVERNRARLRSHLPEEPRWLVQVHGNRAVDAGELQRPIEADAAVSRTPGAVCAVMIADCMPVLLADRAGTVVGAAHAGFAFRLPFNRHSIAHTLATVRRVGCAHPTI